MWKKVFDWLDERLGLNDIYKNLLTALSQEATGGTPLAREPVPFFCSGSERDFSHRLLHSFPGIMPTTPFNTSWKASPSAG